MADGIITKLEVRNPQGSLLTLMLEDDSSGYYIQEIEGLDPVKTTLVSSSTVKRPGAQFQSKKRDPRNIILTLGYNPDYSDETTVASLRSNLYNWFDNDAEVALRFYMDTGLTVNISGEIEKMDAPLFVQDPNAKISIMCFEPDFVDINTEELTGESVDDTTETLVQYTGGVRTGFVFTITFDRTESEFTIYTRSPANVLTQMDVTGDFEVGDVLTISTISGDKYASLLRSGTSSFVAYMVSTQSTWYEFTKGDNYIRVYATGDPLAYTLDYTPRYGGL